MGYPIPCASLGIGEEVAFSTPVGIETAFPLDLIGEICSLCSSCSWVNLFLPFLFSKPITDHPSHTTQASYNIPIITCTSEEHFEPHTATIQTRTDQLRENGYYVPDTNSVPVFLPFGKLKRLPLSDPPSEIDTHPATYALQDVILTAINGQKIPLGISKTPGIIAELGGGEGKPSRLLAQKYPDQQFVVVDALLPGHPKNSSRSFQSIPSNLRLVEHCIGNPKAHLPSTMLGQVKFAFCHNLIDVLCNQLESDLLTRKCVNLTENRFLLTSNACPQIVRSYSFHMASIKASSSDCTKNEPQPVFAIFHSNQ